MTYWKTAFYKALGAVHVPEVILCSEEKKLLHISDTPVSFFSALSRLIKKLKPEYIVHTGDLVDNIKLELYPRSLGTYRDYVRRLLSVLEASDAEKIIIALGNHDDKATVQSFCTCCCIIDLCETVLVGDTKFKISHYPEEIQKDPEAYNLFGHDLSLRSGMRDNRFYLNGVSGINIIEMDSKKLHSLPYPQGINDDRLGKKKIGL